jgi:hypothetical protein
MTVHYCTIQMSRPRGSHPGSIEEGWYTIDGSTVTLCSREGLPHLDGRGRPITAKVGSRETPRQIAGRLLKANLGTLGRRTSGFNRQLSYPRQGLA